MSENKTTVYDIKRNQDLIEITRTLPNGIIVFHHPEIGGSIFRSGDMDALVKFAVTKLVPQNTNFLRQTQRLFWEIVQVSEKEYKKDIKVFLEVMRGQTPPAELPFREISTFLTNLPAHIPVSKCSGLAICCNNQHGFFTANGDTKGIGAVILGAIASGNIPVWDLMVRIVRSVETAKTTIN